MPLREKGHGTHHYKVRCQWSGSTGAGYDAYDRAHTVSASPGAQVAHRECFIANSLNTEVRVEPTVVVEPAADLDQERA